MKRVYQVIWVSIFFLFSTAYAYDQLPGDTYFLVDAPARVPALSSPIEQLTSLMKGVSSDIDLLNWVQYNSKPPKPAEKYVRKHHFGTWIDFPNDETCLKTRALVLERDSKAPVKFYADHPCVVASGKWFDPYTNQTYLSAKEVEIEHVVPLKNAYISGAYRWAWKTRCAYFNFLENPTHLIPIEGQTNRDKSDQSVEQWLPPNQRYHCQYIANWLRVKTIWNLMMSEEETSAIESLISRYHCSADLFKMTTKELKAHRAAIKDIAAECPDSPPVVEETRSLN